MNKNTDADYIIKSKLAKPNVSISTDTAEHHRNFAQIDIQHVILAHPFEGLFNREPICKNF